MHEHISWRPGQRGQCLSDVSSFDSLVAPVDLCPGLLEDEDPNFLIRRAPAEGPVVLMAAPGELIVDYNNLRLPVDVKLHRVAASLVNLLGDEDVLDPLGELGK
jgi:hypothetical protein